MRAGPAHRGSAKLTRVRLAVLGVCALPLGGCGSSASHAGTSGAASVPAYVTEPPTHEQLLVEKGARLVVADGCSACHLNAHSSHLAPSFTSLAGQRIELADGRRVLVDEAFLRASMRDPMRTAMKGYSAAVMVRALARLHLERQPHAVEELAAFIEQVGPEDP